MTRDKYLRKKKPIRNGRNANFESSGICICGSRSVSTPRLLPPPIVNVLRVFHYNDENDVTNNSKPFRVMQRGCRVRSLTRWRACVYIHIVAGLCASDERSSIHVDGRCWWGPIIQHRISRRRHIFRRPGRRKKK